MILNITDNLLRALGLECKNEILKKALINFSEDITKYLSENEIYVLNSRYPDDLDEIITYNKISSKLRLNCSKIPDLENVAKKHFALFCLNIPIVAYLKDICTNLTTSNKDSMQELFSILDQENIITYKDYLINKNVFTIDIRQKLEQLWSTLELGIITDYLYPVMPNQMSNLNIVDLQVSLRIENAICKNYGLISLDKLVFFSKKDFSSIRNLGEKCYIELLEKLHSMNLNLFFESTEMTSLKIDSKEYEKIMNEKKYYELLQKKQELEKKLNSINKEIEKFQSKLEKPFETKKNR